MFEFLAKVIEMTSKSLTEHGLIKTCVALMGLLVFVASIVFVWRLPEIIMAIRWW